MKDLHNFKGYHNQDANKKEEAERYIDPKNGAHFKFNDICNRILNIAKNREQEKKIKQLTGKSEQLDETYYQAIGGGSGNAQIQSLKSGQKINVIRNESSVTINPSSEQQINLVK